MLPTAAQMRALDEGTISQSRHFPAVWPLMKAQVAASSRVWFHSTAVDAAFFDRARFVIVAGPWQQRRRRHGHRALPSRGWVFRFELWIVAIVHASGAMHRFTLAAAERAGVTPRFCDGDRKSCAHRLASLSDDVVMDVTVWHRVCSAASPAAWLPVIRHISASRACTIAVDFPSGPDASRHPSPMRLAIRSLQSGTSPSRLAFPLGLVGSPAFCSLAKLRHRTLAFRRTRSASSGLCSVARCLRAGQACRTKIPVGHKEAVMVT